MASAMNPIVDPFPAAAIEALCRELGEAVTGQQISNLIAPLSGIPETPEERRSTKWKRLFNVVIRAQNRQNDGRPMIRLVTEVMRPVRFPSVEQFDFHRAAINERLVLSGFLVREDGRIARVSAATTLSEAKQRASALREELGRRHVHDDVLTFCRVELLHDNYFHAVLEAAKSVAEKIRVLTGLQLDGNSLIDAACSTRENRPLLAFNALDTDWERSEHQGLATLCRGLFSTFRNPAAHAPRILWAVEQAEALDMLTLASMLHRRLDGARIAEVAPAGRADPSA